MKEEIKITKEDLVMWLDRPPSDDDFDLCSFLAKAVENQKKYYEENKSLQSQLKAKEEVIDKAIEYINKSLIISSILNGKKTYCLNNYTFDYKELLDILKEIEETNTNVGEVE